MATIATAPLAGTTAEDLHLVVGRIARALRQAHTVGDLTHSEASTLARLDQGGPTYPGALAEGERVSPQAMAATLAVLESKGYVGRQPDPSDGRRLIISLTPLGEKVRHGRRTESAQRLAAGIAVLDEAELGRLAAALPLLDRVAQHL